jgi:hypothetical protein
MEETKDFSWKESKTLTSDRLGRIVPIPVRTTDMTIKETLPPADEADVAVDAVKRRLASALSRKLHEE